MLRKALRTIGASLVSSCTQALTAGSLPLACALCPRAAASAFGLQSCLTLCLKSVSAAQQTPVKPQQPSPRLLCAACLQSCSLAAEPALITLTASHLCSADVGILRYTSRWAVVGVCAGVHLVLTCPLAKQGTGSDLHSRFDALPLVVLYELLSLALHSRKGIALWGAVWTLGYRCFARGVRHRMGVRWSNQPFGMRLSAG